MKCNVFYLAKVINIIEIIIKLMKKVITFFLLPLLGYQRQHNCQECLV